MRLQKSGSGLFDEEQGLFQKEANGLLDKAEGAGCAGKLDDAALECAAGGFSEPPPGGVVVVPADPPVPGIPAVPGGVIAEGLPELRCRSCGMSFANGIEYRNHLASCAGGIPSSKF